MPKGSVVPFGPVLLAGSMRHANGLPRFHPHTTKIWWGSTLTRSTAPCACADGRRDSPSHARWATYVTGVGWQPLSPRLTGQGRTAQATAPRLGRPPPDLHGNFTPPDRPQLLARSYHGVHLERLLRTGGEPHGLRVYRKPGSTSGAAAVLTQVILREEHGDMTSRGCACRPPTPKVNGFAGDEDPQARSPRQPGQRGPDQHERPRRPLPRQDHQAGVCRPGSSTTQRPSEPV